MTTFLDGPAKEQNLMLKAAPRFLRAVESIGGTWDALDQPQDTPHCQEKLYAYELAEKLGMCHIRRKGGGGFYVIANYRYLPSQPTDAEMRTVKGWEEWCARNTL